MLVAPEAIERILLFFEYMLSPIQRQVQTTIPKENDSAPIGRLMQAGRR